MKKIYFLIIATLLSINIVAQPAKAVLDKTAATLNSRGGVTADFVISNDMMSDIKGKISVKGQMFKADMPQMTIWYDGKTQWSYVKESDEVNVNNPTETEQQLINPYSFLNMYKNGFNYTMKTFNNYYEVRLTAKDKKRHVQEMIINIKKDYIPSKIRMRYGAKWNTITINSLKKENLSDNVFKFNRKDYPSAEIIDLR